MTDAELSKALEVEAERDQLRIRNADMLAAFKAMSQAHYDQPIGAWFGVIRGQIARAENP